MVDKKVLHTHISVFDVKDGQPVDGQQYCVVTGLGRAREDEKGLPVGAPRSVLLSLYQYIEDSMTPEEINALPLRKMLKVRLGDLESFMLLLQSEIARLRETERQGEHNA